MSVRGCGCEIPDGAHGKKVVVFLLLSHFLVWHRQQAVTVDGDLDFRSRVKVLLRDQPVASFQLVDLCVKQELFTRRVLLKPVIFEL